VCRLCGKGGVVGCGSRPDVARRAGKPFAKLAAAGATAATSHLGDRIELLAIPVRAGDVVDGTGVVEKRLLVHEDRLELEFEGDVGKTIAVVVDEDLVQHVGAELVEVRTACGILERDVVGDQRDVVGSIGTDECIDVSAVCDGIFGHLRRFAV
jgi:hypothetical protein